MTTSAWWDTWALLPVPSLVLYQAPFLSLPVALRDLLGVEQNPRYHPEGCVFTHTLCVVDEAARIAQRDCLSDADAQVLVLSALCHDLGKPKTTVRNAAGNWVAPKHDSEGVGIAVDFLLGVGFDAVLANRVGELVKRHMAHGSFVGQPSSKMVRRLSAKLEAVGSSLVELGRLVEADMSGRPPLTKGLPAAFRLMLDCVK